jgi:hypothetical protein
MRFAMPFRALAGLLTAACLLAAAPALRAQDASLEETLNQLSGDAASAYLSPISSAFGSNLNSGWFHRAPKAVKLGFNLEAGLITMGSFFPTDANHFAVNGTFRFSQDEANVLLDYYEDEQNVDIDLVPGLRTALVNQITAQSSTVGISGATVVGASTDSVTIAYQGQTFTVGGQDYAIPAQDIVLPFGGFGDLADIPVMPLAAPQLTFGTIYGTQFTLRYLPAMEVNADLGDFKYMGFGIQHNPALWLKKKLPVDVAASFFTQSMEVGTLFKCKTTAFGVNASKTWGWRFLNLTPYAGYMLEDATMEVAYDFIVDVPVAVDTDGVPDGQMVEPISLDLASENSSRLTAGLNVRLGIVNVNVDYSMAKYSAFSAGINLAF